MRSGAQHLAFELKFEYIAHRSTNIPWAGGLASFQKTGARCVKQSFAVSRSVVPKLVRTVSPIKAANMSDYPPK